MKTRNQEQGSTGSAGAPSEPASRAVEAPNLRLDEGAGRSQWIRVQLIKGLMDVAPGRQILSVTLIPVVAGFCWSDANRFALLLWLFSALPITAARLWVGRLYARRYADADAEVQSAFVRLLLPLAMMEGAFWGASVWLFFQRIPVIDQFGCWVILTIQLIGPLTRLAFVPRLMQGYISAFFVVALAGVAYSLKVSIDGRRFDLWFVALILFQWFSIQY